MTPEQWARILADLHEEDEQRRAALLAMSDEDWMADEEREWIRESAKRRTVLNPGRPKYLLWYWSSEETNCPYEDCSKISDRLVSKIGRVNGRDEPSNKGQWTRNHDTPEGAWLDLLRAVSREGAR